MVSLADAASAAEAAFVVQKLCQDEPPNQPSEDCSHLGEGQVGGLHPPPTFP